MSEKSFHVCVRCNTYNQAPYIVKTLQGFSIQETNFPVVYVVIDDASTDGEQLILRKWAEDNLLSSGELNVWRDMPYGKLAVAPLKEKHNSIFAILLLDKNHYQNGIGIKKLEYISEWYVQAKYLAFCEGDDFWTHPHKLQKQVEFLEKNEEYVVVYTNTNVVDKNNDLILHRTPRRYSGNITKKLLRHGNFIVTASTCYRNYHNEWNKELSHIPIKLKMSDMPMWIFYSTKGKFKYFKEKMASYRVLPESASHSTNRIRILDFNKNAGEIVKYYNQRYNIGLSNKDIDLKYYKLGVRALAKLSREEFLEEWKKLIEKHKIALFDLKLNMIAFIRVALNKRV